LTETEYQNIEQITESTPRKRTEPMGENAQAATPCFDSYSTGKEKRSRTTKKMVVQKLVERKKLRDDLAATFDESANVRSYNGAYPNTWNTVDGAEKVAADAQLVLS